MIEEKKQYYIKRMEAKALAYAENVLSDIKNYLPKDEYEEMIRDFAQAFISGGDAAIATMNEILKEKQL